MNLYYVLSGYKTLDSMVVCCKNENAARMTHPSVKDWNGIACDGWSDASDVDVQYLGVADPLIKAGVICKSFNAG